MGGQYAGGVGSYDLTLVAGGDERPVEFDATVGEIGWNVLGEFDLPAGEARVELSDATSGLLVVADAIRWEPVRGEEPARGE
jgi:hypothetical protein